MDLVVGGGAVLGCEPVEYLKKKRRDFVLVDADPNCLAVKRYGLKKSTKVDATGEFFLQGDLATALSLITDLTPEYVFPTDPIHIVAELAKIKFRLEPWDEAINPMLPYLPQAVVFRAGRGELVVTFNRDKDCIAKCEAPEVFQSPKIKRCTMDRPRPCSMDRLMRFACPQAFILFSYTMSPGLGAFKGKEMLKFFDWAEKKKKFVVGTACNCHGVFWGFKKTSVIR